MPGRWSHLCTIKRKSTSNVDGVITPSFTVKATNQLCALQEGRGQIERGDMGQALEYDAIVYFPRGTDIQPRRKDDDQDQITITDPTPEQELLVQFVADASGRVKRNAPLKAYCERVTSPT